MLAAGAGLCLCSVLSVRLGQPGAAKQGNLRQWRPTYLATATCPCKQAGDDRGAAGSSSAHPVGAKAATCSEDAWVPHLWDR